MFFVLCDKDSHYRVLEEGFSRSLRSLALLAPINRFTGKTFKKSVVAPIHEEIVKIIDIVI